MCHTIATHYKAEMLASPFIKGKLMTFGVLKTYGDIPTRKPSTQMKHQIEAFRRIRESHLKYQRTKTPFSSISHKKR